MQIVSNTNFILPLLLRPRANLAPNTIEPDFPTLCPYQIPPFQLNSAAITIFYYII